MKKIIALGFVPVFLFACTSKSPNPMSITVEDTNYKDWNSLMEIEEVIPLQDTNFTPKLSVANKCIVGEQQILFWDYKAKLVYAYNTKGNYLFTVGGIGRSDKEYVDICDVAFSPTQKEIHILDRSGIKIYDAHSGLFLNKRLFEGIDISSVQGFLPCEENSYLIFTPNNEYSICMVDSINHLIPLRKRNGYQMKYNRFNRSNSQYMVLPDYGNFTIDCIQGDNIMPAYTIDLGGSALPKGMIPNDYESFVQVDDSKEYFKVILDYYENRGYVYASMVGPNQTYYDLIYDKANGKAYVGPHEEYTNIVYTGMDNEYLYGLVYLDYVKSESPYYDTFSHYIEQGTHNPLIVKIKLRT